MKYLKLFESFLEKDKLKEGYEKFVMSKDYIPNLIEKKNKRSFFRFTNTRPNKI